MSDDDDESKDELLRLALLIGSTLQLSVGVIQLAALFVFNGVVIPGLATDELWARALYVQLLGFGLLNVPAGVLGIVCCIDIAGSPVQQEVAKQRRARRKVAAEAVTLVYVCVCAAVYAFYVLAVCRDSDWRLSIAVLPLVAVQCLWLGVCVWFKSHLDARASGYAALPSSEDAAGRAPSAQTRPQQVSALSNALERALQPHAAAETTVWFPTLAPAATAARPSFSGAFALPPISLQPGGGGSGAGERLQGLQSSEGQVLGSSLDSAASNISMRALVATSPKHALGAGSAVHSSTHGASTSQAGRSLSRVGEDADEGADELVLVASGGGDGGDRPAKSTLGTYLDQVLSLTGLGARPTSVATNSTEPSVSVVSGASPTFRISVNDVSEPTTPNNVGGSPAEVDWSPVRSQGSAVPESTDASTATLLASGVPAAPDDKQGAPTNTEPNGGFLYNIYNTLTLRARAPISEGADAPVKDGLPVIAPSAPLPQPQATPVSGSRLATAGHAADRAALAKYRLSFPSSSASLPSPSLPSASAPSTSVPAAATPSPSRGLSASLAPRSADSNTAVAGSTAGHNSHSVNWASLADSKQGSAGFGNMMMRWNGDQAATLLEGGPHGNDWTSSVGSDDGLQDGKGDELVYRVPLAPHGSPKAADAQRRELAGASGAAAEAPRLTSTVLGMFNSMWRSSEPVKPDRRRFGSEVEGASGQVFMDAEGSKTASFRTAEDGRTSSSSVTL